MTRFQVIKRLFCLPLLAALSQGCNGIADSGSTLKGLGFASDTTAILFYELWEKHDGGFLDLSSHGTSYYGWELLLVDVRFHRVYWRSQIDHSRHDEILRSYQWSDSTMLVGQSDEFWLWTVGNKKPQKINFDWQTEKKNHTPGGLTRLRFFKNDFALLFSAGSFDQVILDTKTMTINAWDPGENAWIADCRDVWWEEEVGWMCLMGDENPCSLSLLLGNGDTLSGIIYAHECKEFDITHFYRYFIRASLGGCNPQASKCYTYPTKVESGEIYSAMFRYGKNGSIVQKPSFWMYRGEESRYLKFVDSLGNVARY